MKREDLEKLGLTKEQVNAVCDLNNADVRPLKDKLQTTEESLKAAQGKLTVAEEALKKFDGIEASDIAAKDKMIQNLKEDLSKKEKEYKDQLAERDFQSALKESIDAAHGRNAKAITALLDLDALKASKNQKEDMAAALKSLAEAEDSKMLFGESETSVVGRGNPIGSIRKSGSESSDAAMRAAMGLPPVEEQK